MTETFKFSGVGPYRLTGFVKDKKNTRISVVCGNRLQAMQRIRACKKSWPDVVVFCSPVDRHFYRHKRNGTEFMSAESIEDFSSAFRFVGYADEIATRSITHTGWFCDVWDEDTYRGVVFRLPGQRGFLYGYEEKYSDYVVLDVSDIVEDVEDKYAAAIRADEMAQRYAEEDKEASIYDMASNRIAETEDDIQSIWKAIKSDRAELNAMFSSLCRKSFPRSFSALRARVKRNVEQIKECRETIKKCKDDPVSFFTM